MIITSIPSKISSHGACNPGISNHHLAYAAANLRGISEKPKLKRVRDFKRVDTKALQLEFAFAPWFICDVFDDIGDSVWAWEAPCTSSTNIFLLVRVKLDLIVFP